MNIARRIVLVAGSSTLVAYVMGLNHWDTPSQIIVTGILAAEAIAILYFAVGKKKGRPTTSN